MERKITAIMVYYYFVCHRKLWYFYHHIAMEQNSEAVAIGKALDELSYDRNHKQIQVHQTIHMDFIKNNTVIHEVKKSNKIEQASIWQVKYYIYYLEMVGVKGMVGKLDYPLLKKTVDIQLTQQDRSELQRIIQQIDTILEQPIAAIPKNKSLCNKCAYRDLCLI